MGLVSDFRLLVFITSLRLDINVPCECIFHARMEHPSIQRSCD
jgi:hypothetical protein